MAKIRNISGDDRFVPELAKLVTVDSVTDVPDDRIDAYVCQSETWVVVTDTPPRSAKPESKETSQ